MKRFQNLSGCLISIIFSIQRPKLLDEKSDLVVNDRIKRSK